MCELYALSSAAPTKPQDDFAVLQSHGLEPFGNLSGWGVSWENGDRPSLFKAPESASFAGGFPAIVTAAPEARTWIVHLRAASSGGNCLENTQPYHFDIDASTLTFAHNGDLGDISNHPEFRAHSDERQGNADSECAQIILKYRLRNTRDIEAQWEVFQAFAAEMRNFGPANFLVRIGENIFAQSDRRKPVGQSELTTPGLTLWQGDDQAKLSSEPMGEDWNALNAGETIWLRDGKIIDRESADRAPSHTP